jgi:phosphomannomutase
MKTTKGNSDGFPGVVNRSRISMLFVSRKPNRRRERGNSFEIVNTVKANGKMDRIWKELGFKSNEPSRKLL